MSGWVSIKQCGPWTSSLPQVGIVGRTGSGKSSLVSALLRLNQVVKGDVEVDGVSLVRLGLDDARAPISWIPQEPHLFSGSLR